MLHPHVSIRLSCLIALILLRSRHTVKSDIVILRLEDEEQEGCILSQVLSYANTSRVDAPVTGPPR